MSERHEQRRRAHDETTCDDDRPATLAATLACAAGDNGMCREHTRKRRVMIRHSDEIVRGTVALREVL